MNSFGSLFSRLKSGLLVVLFRWLAKNKKVNEHKELVHGTSQAKKALSGPLLVFYLLFGSLLVWLVG